MTASPASTTGSCYLPPDAPPAELAARRRAGEVVVALRRRGVRHGAVAIPAGARGFPDRPGERWRAARPLLLPDVLGPYLEPSAPLLEATRAMFGRLRSGARFLDEVAARMCDPESESFAPAGCTVDLLDERAIEKVHVDGLQEGAVVARDLWAKLSWIADDRSDTSLRIAFSCGVESLDEWASDAERARWADRFADAVFPECAMVVENDDLVQVLDALAGTPLRCSERIVYSNAPGGGAVFHQDAEAGQRGVLYAQLDGWTAWLALPKRELATLAAEHASATGGPAAYRDAEAVLRALDAPDRTLWQLLNNEPAFTARLIAAGTFHLLRAGDVLLLPTQGPDDVAWHSVFALGRAPSLGHSYGLFPDEP